MTDEAFALFAAALFGLFAPTCFANPDTRNNNEQVITAGVGLSACPIGCDKQQFVSLFSEAKIPGSSVLAWNHGIEAHTMRGRVVAVFFYFNTKRMSESDADTSKNLWEEFFERGAELEKKFGTKSDFRGRTNTGIGADSSIKDVIKSHGKPDKRYEGIGPFGKGQEVSLEYSRKGISFTFINNRLSDIRIFSPPQAAPTLSSKELREKLLGEWQHNLLSGYQGMPFKENFLTGNIGPVLSLNSDETASYTIPCDVNEKLNTKLRLEGRWKLTDKSFFSLSLKGKEGDEVIDLSIEGKLRLDEKSDEIDHLIVTQTNDKSTKYGRFNRSLLNCN